jgi:hypothetical protein
MLPKASAAPAGGAQGEILKTIQEVDGLQYGTDTPVEIPIAGIDLGTRWCRGTVWGVTVTYPCGW